MLVPRMRYCTCTCVTHVMHECSDFWSYLSYRQCLVPRCPDTGGLSVHGNKDDFHLSTEGP